MAERQTPDRETRGALYEILRQDAPFEEKAAEALALGNRYLGTTTGMLTQVETETGDWEILVSTDPPEGALPAGLERELEETYCRQVVGSGSQVHLHDVAAEEWTENQAATAHAAGCYLGTPLVRDGNVEGTVCFVADEPRAERFQQDELLLAELLTQLLEREFDNQQTEEELRAQRATARQREEAIQAAYEVIAESDRSFDDQVTALLEVVRETVGTEYATLSHAQGDEYEFKSVAAPPGADISPGDTIPLETTSCERVVETTEKLILDNMQKEAPELAERAGNREWGISCYLGAPVTVDGDVYGTFCFYGTNVRIEEFSRWEVTFVDLLSDWVGRQLERRERERALDEAKTQLEAATEAAGVGTWEWHVQEDRLLMGPSFAEMFGVDPDSAREGVSVDRFLAGIHGEDRERVRERIDQAMDRCGEYESEYRVWDDDGEARWVVARGRVECDDDGTPVRFPGALTDITERKRAEQELERQNKRLEQFASVISHDLRNPLNVIELHLDLEQEEHESENLDAIENAHQRMETMIADLLTLARQGDTVEDLELVEVEPLVEECRETVETTEATVEVDSEQQIQANRSRLKQVFENLFRNSVEHSSTGSRAKPDDSVERSSTGSGSEDGGVTIRVGDLPDGFYVEDDGPGIPSDKRDKLFELGYTTSGDGTGFGLSIVKQVVEAHGWEISVTESADGGARFEITGIESGFR